MLDYFRRRFAADTAAATPRLMRLLMPRHFAMPMPPLTQPAVGAQRQLMMLLFAVDARAFCYAAAQYAAVTRCRKDTAQMRATRSSLPRRNIADAATL